MYKMVEVARLEDNIEIKKIDAPFLVPDFLIEKFEDLRLIRTLEVVIF